MSRWWIVAQKEFRDAWRDKLIIALVICLSLLIIVSVVIATQHVGTEAAQYQAALAQIQASGQVSKLVPPSFAPLRLLQNSVEYFEIIGSVLAIILGYMSIAREKESQVLPIILSRRITRIQYITGKLIGNILILTVLVGCFACFAALAILIVAGLPLSTEEIVKLLLTSLCSLAYLAIFYAFAAMLALYFRTSANALVLSLAVWILFVLVLPQVGDTMDVDNQVPGGFFASLNLPKGSEKKVLAHFATYEQIRNGTEVASPTKHYERASFALLGVKQEYDGKSLGYILGAKWDNLTTLAVVTLGMSALLLYGAHRNKMIWRS